MLWQRLFASQDPESGNRDLAVGTVWAAVMYFSLYLIPQAVTAFLIPLVFLPLFGLCVTLRAVEPSTSTNRCSRTSRREHPHVYRKIVRDCWRSALFVGIIGFCTGIMRALAVADMQAGSLVNILSMGSMMIAAIALLLAWNLRNIRLNVSAIYRMAFPFVITSFLLLPLLPAVYGRWLAAVLYAFYSVAIALMMVQCAQISRDRGVNPVFVYGFFGTIVYALHDVGFIGGTLAENMIVIGLSPLAMVALIAVYLMAPHQLHRLGRLQRSAQERRWHRADGADEGRARSAHRDEKGRQGGAPRTPKRKGTQLAHAVGSAAANPASTTTSDAAPRSTQTGEAKRWDPPVRRSHLRASRGHSRTLPPDRARDRDRRAHRPRQHCRAHRRDARRFGEHGAHALEAHLHQA